MDTDGYLVIRVHLCGSVVENVDLLADGERNGKGIDLSLNLGKEERSVFSVPP